MKNRKPGIPRPTKIGLAGICLVFASNIVFAADVRYEAIDLGTLPGGEQSDVRSINASREAVGLSDDDTKKIHAVLYRQGKVVDLGTLPGGEYSAANGINDRHQVVGDSEVTGGGRHAFLYSDGIMQDLGVPDGATSSVAYAINEEGKIVGTASFGTGRNAMSRGVVYSKGRWRLGGGEYSFSCYQ